MTSSFALAMLKSVTQVHNNFFATSENAKLCFSSTFCSLQEVSLMSWIVNLSTMSNDDLSSTKVRTVYKSLSPELPFDACASNTMSCSTKRSISFLNLLNFFSVPRRFRFLPVRAASLPWYVWAMFNNLNILSLKRFRKFLHATWIIFKSRALTFLYWLISKHFVKVLNISRNRSKIISPSVLTQEKILNNDIPFRASFLAIFLSFIKQKVRDKWSRKRWCKGEVLHRFVEVTSHLHCHKWFICVVVANYLMTIVVVAGNLFKAAVTMMVESFNDVQLYNPTWKI